MTRDASKGRIGVASVVALGAVIAFAAIGGTSIAGGANPSNGQYNNASKVTVCHKGKVTIRIAAPAVPAHTAHGDKLGLCTQASAATSTPATHGAAKPKKSKGSESTSTSSTETSNAAHGNSNGKGKGKG